MASKLAFRARAPDAAKPLPIYHVDELPDFAETANRAVPPMPTGMEKNEECEHHLLRAISARQKYGEGTDKNSDIPIPDVIECPEEYGSIYPQDATQPKNYIHVPPYSLEPSKPDYDLDSEDDEWFTDLKKKDTTFEDFTELEFEEMMDRMEKASAGHAPLTLKEARMMLNQDDDLIDAVFNYWVEKRARYAASVCGKIDKTGAPLVASIYPLVLTSAPLGVAPNSPYIAFRKRTEKMQTRKNRKNDEYAYEKMVRLRRDLMKAITLLEMVKRREKLKREYLNLTVEIVEKRFQLNDWKGEVLMGALKMKNNKQTVRAKSNSVKKAVESPRFANNRKRSKEFEEHEFKLPAAVLPAKQAVKAATPPPPPKPSIPQTAFAFKRRPGCRYSYPIPDATSWSRTKWKKTVDGEDVEEPPKVVDPFASLPDLDEIDNGKGDLRLQFHLSSSRFPKNRCLGFVRRRIGRGGRVVLDRLESSMNAVLPQLDDASEPGTSCDIKPPVNLDDVEKAAPYYHNLLKQQPHFSPKIDPPPQEIDDHSSDEEEIDPNVEYPSSCWLKDDNSSYTGREDWGVPSEAPYARQYLLPWSLTFGGSSDDESEGEEPPSRGKTVFEDPVTIKFDTIPLETAEEMLQARPSSGKGKSRGPSFPESSVVVTRCEEEGIEHKKSLGTQLIVEKTSNSR